MIFEGTKGKWIVDCSESENGRQLIIVRNKEFDNNTRDLRISFSSVDEESKTIDRYNALLISKAPEMLEMLQKIVEQYDNYAIRDEDIKQVKNLIKLSTKID